MSLLLRLNVLEIIYCALKLSCELLKRSAAMKAIFKNTHKGQKQPEERGGEVEEGKASQTLWHY